MRGMREQKGGLGSSKTSISQKIREDILLAIRGEKGRDKRGGWGGVGGWLGGGYTSWIKVSSQLRTLVQKEEDWDSRGKNVKTRFYNLKAEGGVDQKMKICKAREKILGTH